MEEKKNLNDNENIVEEVRNENEDVQKKQLGLGWYHFNVNFALWLAMLSGFGSSISIFFIAEEGLLIAAGVFSLISSIITIPTIIWLKKFNIAGVKSIITLRVLSVISAIFTLNVGAIIAAIIFVIIDAVYYYNRRDLFIKKEEENIKTENE